MNTTMLTDLTPEFNFLTAAPAERTVSPSTTASVLDPALFFRSADVVAVPASGTTRSRRTACRRTHVNWDTVAVILLMLLCTAVGLYRLLWMGQL